MTITSNLHCNRDPRPHNNRDNIIAYRYRISVKKTITLEVVCTYVYMFKLSKLKLYMYVRFQFQSTYKRNNSHKKLKYVIINIKSLTITISLVWASMIKKYVLFYYKLHKIIKRFLYANQFSLMYIHIIHICTRSFLNKFVNPNDIICNLFIY